MQPRVCPAPSLCELPEGLQSPRLSAQTGGQAKGSGVFSSSAWPILQTLTTHRTIFCSSTGPSASAGKRFHHRWSPASDQEALWPSPALLPTNPTILAHAASVVGAQTKTLKAAPWRPQERAGSHRQGSQEAAAGNGHQAHCLMLGQGQGLLTYHLIKATSSPPRQRSGDRHWLKAAQPVSGGANAQTGHHTWEAVLGPSHPPCQPTGPLPLPPASLTSSSAKLQTRPPGPSTTEEPPWEPRTLAQPHKGFRNVRQLWEGRRLRDISHRRGLLAP